MTNDEFDELLQKQRDKLDGEYGRVAVFINCIWDRYPEATYQLISDLAQLIKTYDETISNGGSPRDAMIAGLSTGREIRRK
jgi:hypothetical protein